MAPVQQFGNIFPSILDGHSVPDGADIVFVQVDHPEGKAAGKPLYHGRLVADEGNPERAKLLLNRRRQLPGALFRRLILTVNMVPG